MAVHEVYLSLGSNIGDRRRLMELAIDAIGEQVGTVVRRSAFYETEPWGFSTPNKFLNAAVCVDTLLSPRQLLEATQKIERELGRVHKTQAVKGFAQQASDISRPLPEYHDRPIDIDILLYDDLTVDEPDLKIPHPLMHERDFVMRPLNELRGR